MRKIIIFIMIFLFSYLDGSYGFINSRYVWWKKRYQTLNDEKRNMLSGNDYNSVLPGLIDNEIERTRGILQIFETEVDGRGSLNYHRQRYSITEIQNIIKETAAPLFNSYYLDFLVNNAGGEYGMERNRELVKSLLTDLMKEYLNDYNEDLLNTLIKEKISSSDWKYICMEVLILSMEKNKDINFKNTVGGIEKLVLDEVSNNKLLLTQKEIKDTIQIKAEEYLASLNREGLVECGAEILNDSWCWNKISKEVKKELQFLKNAVGLIGESRPDKNFMEIYSYYKNPPWMEKTVFAKLTADFIDRSKLKKRVNNKADGYVMAVPELPNMEVFMKEIDASRIERVFETDGLEDDAYFCESDKTFNNIVNKYFKSVGDAFSIEEEKLKIKIAESESGALFNKVPEIVNESEFKEVKDIFENNLRHAHIYMDKSREYLRLCSEIKKPRGVSIVDNHKTRLKQNSNYISFMQDLVKGCVGLAGIESAEARNKFSISVQRTSNVYKSIDLSFSIDKDERTSLSGDNLNNINNIKNDIQNAIRNSKLEINNFYCGQVKKFRCANRPATDEEKMLKKRIAELEIELINNKIHDFVSCYDKLNYTDEILKQYSEKFNELEKDVRSNSKSPGLDSAIKSNSIFPLMKNFDRLKFLKEYNTRRYLSIDLNRDMARLKTLTEFYKRNGIVIKNRSLDEDIREIKLKLNLKPSVRIAGWIMNEINFDDIDKNAVKRLNFIEKRNIWINNSSEEADGAQLPVTIENLNIILKIPVGWIEQQLVNSEIRNGIVKFYRSADGKSSIYIGGVNPHGMDNREISEFWMNKMGQKKLKERWGKKDNIEYLWTLSNSKKKDVMELYALSCNNRVILISGITTKDKYNYFKGKIDSIFNSITPAM